jgi:vacuolar-type H+-ATPase subunit H
MESVMTDRNDGIKRWMGFKADAETVAEMPSTASTGNTGALARIRELEAQLADLRSRRDITTLTKEEFEILATETAMTLIRTAQQREAKATQSAERVLGESKRAAQAAIEAAEGKARSLLSQAESKGRRLIDAAENDAKELLQAAESRAEEMVNTKRREGVAIVSTARKEAEQMVTSALSDVASYRAWLSGVVAEAERLYKVQTQSLDAATSAIEQSRGRLDAAWERLSQLSNAVERTVDESGKPRIPRRDDASGGESGSKESSRSAPTKSSKKPARGKKK